MSLERVTDCDATIFAIGVGFGGFGDAVSAKLKELGELRRVAASVSDAPYHG